MILKMSEQSLWKRSGQTANSLLQITYLKASAGKQLMLNLIHKPTIHKIKHGGHDSPIHGFENIETFFMTEINDFLFGTMNICLALHSE